MYKTRLSLNLRYKVLARERRQIEESWYYEEQERYLYESEIAD